MNDKPYKVEPIPKMRRFSLDAGYLGRRRHIVHGLIEVDISNARQIIRAHKAQTGESLSLTAFVIFCLAKAIEKNKHLHAYRDWRSRLVIYDDINVNAMIEVQHDGRLIPMPYIFEAVNKMTYRDVHEQLRAAQTKPGSTNELNFMRWFLILPAFLRRIFYWVVMRLPQTFRKYSSSVQVTAVGMFGKRGGWGITMPNFTLTVVIGGIVKKPGVVNDEIAVREDLDLTVSVDHDIVDGAPIARFVNDFQDLLENGFGLGV
jgi:hypothetical protein